MTDALCLNCGAIKFGALCPCPNCQAAATGDINLDIAFSDHHLARETLEEFGRVIAAIHEESSDEELCFWSFLTYINTNHPEVLRIKLDPEAQEKCERLLASITVPGVSIRPGRRAQTQGDAPTEASPQRTKRWWNFWR